MRDAAMVAGVTVAITAEVAPALSVTVSVTGVAAFTLFGVNVKEAPLIAEATGTSAGLLESTVNGPLPPVIPTVLGVLPNATNVAGLASKLLETVGVVEELPPPQPDSVNSSAEATPVAPSASLSKEV